MADSSDSLQRNDNRSLSSGSGNADLGSDSGPPREDTASIEPDHQGGGGPTAASEPAAMETPAPEPQSDAQARPESDDAGEEAASANGSTAPANGGSEGSDGASPGEPSGAGSAEPEPNNQAQPSSSAADQPASPEPGARSDGSESSGSSDAGGASPSEANATEASTLRSPSIDLTLDQSVQPGLDLAGRSINFGVDISHRNSLELEVLADDLIGEGLGDLTGAADALNGMQSELAQDVLTVGQQGLDSGSALLATSLSGLGASAGELSGVASETTSALSGLPGQALSGGAAIASAGSSALTSAVGAVSTGALDVGGTTLSTAADLSGAAADLTTGAASDAVEAASPLTDLAVPNIGAAETVVGSAGPSGFLGNLFASDDDEEEEADAMSSDLEDIAEGGLLNLPGTQDTADSLTDGVI